MTWPMYASPSSNTEYYEFVATRQSGLEAPPVVPGMPVRARTFSPILRQMVQSEEAEAGTARDAPDYEQVIRALIRTRQAMDADDAIVQVDDSPDVSLPPKKAKQ